MRIILDQADIEAAPQEVRNWLASVSGIGGAAVATEKVEKPKAEKPKAEKVEKPKAAPKDEMADLFGDSPAPEPKKTEPPTLEEVRAKAMALCKSSEGGQAKLLECLKKVGASNIKECPTEKLAELLALIAVA